MRESKVYLEPIEHVYIHKDTGQKYKSVTTVLSMLEPPFEAESISMAIANQPESRKKERYKGMNQQEILDAWKKENEDANEYGTEIHEIMERYLLNKLYIPKNEYERELILKFQKVDPMGSPDIYPETILFSEKHNLAGTADIIEDCGDYFNVLDFKTNKRITFMSEFGHWLNKPLSHLSDCQYNIYGLQMSIYAYMYQMETRKKVGKLCLIYYNPEHLEWELIHVPYMGLEAKRVLDYWVETQQKK
jgi:hypothetical protein